MPAYYVRYPGLAWERIDLHEFTQCVEAMGRHPAFWEGVKVAIQYTLVLF